MKTSTCMFTVILSSLFISGCDNPKSAEWYKSHPDEMNDRYNKCKASGDDTQDCRNARQARFELRQKNAPIPNFN